MIDNNFKIIENEQISFSENLYIEKNSDLNQIYIFNNENTVVIDIQEFPVFDYNEFAYWVDEENKKGIIIHNTDNVIYSFNLNSGIFKKEFRFDRLDNPRFQGLYLIDNSKLVFIIFEEGIIALSKNDLTKLWDSKEIILYSEVEVGEKVIVFSEPDKSGSIDVSNGKNV